MNTFATDIKRFQELINATIKGSSFRDMLLQSVSTDKINNYIETLIRHCEGGKRIRAYLVKVGYELILGESDERILFPSLAYEIFQTGVLIHDDIVDKGEMRRFKPSMYVELGNNHLGISKSICIGDIAILVSNLFIVKSDFSDTLRIAAIDTFLSNIIGTVAGEMIDIILSDDDEYSEQDIIAMYELKTSLYTITGPLMLGAVLAGATNIQQESIKRFGRFIGIAFQIKDDILGIFGDESVIGKSVLSDAREGKKTLLTAHFNRMATSTQIKRFYDLYGNSNIEIRELDIIRGLLIETGSLNYSEQLVKKYSLEAQSIIPELGTSQPIKDKISGLLDYLVLRKY